ncbi:unnamed protein product, partial [Adineta ricciae]
NHVISVATTLMIARENILAQQVDLVVLATGNTKSHPYGE